MTDDMVGPSESLAGGDPEPPSLSLAFLADPNSIHTRRWLAFFLDRGHAVHLILASDRPLEVALDGRLVLHPMAPPSRSWRRIAGLLRTRRTIRRILDDAGTDVLHAHYLTGYGWLARLSGFHPYVVTVWGSDVYLTPATSLVARAWAWASLRGADLVTADSVDLGEAAVRLGALRRRTRLVQFGVDTVRFRPGLDASGLRSEVGADGRRVVFVPRSITPLYRTLTVVRAMRSLPDDCLLLLTEYNHEPSYLATVRAEVARLKLADRVRFIEGIEHRRMAEAYALADVVVSIPESDGTPVSVLEAMACGRPVVSTDLPSVREWLQEAAPWALVPVDDETKTTNAIRLALDLDPDARRSLGALLRDIVASRADYERNMRKVEAAYRALANG